MRGKYTLYILEALLESGKRSIDIMEVFLTSPYGTSYRGFEYRLQKKQHIREQEELKRISEKRFYNLIYRLKQDGLIKKDNNNFLITSKGKAFWERLTKRKKEYIPSNQYHTTMSNRFVIVAFDIPEKERRKRDWLREVLKHIGLTMVQKSLWMGKLRLPQELVHDLHKLNMTDYVEIFEITRTGSLKHVI